MKPFIELFGTGHGTELGLRVLDDLRAWDHLVRAADDVLDNGANFFITTGPTPSTAKLDSLGGPIDCGRFFGGALGRVATAILVTNQSRAAAIEHVERAFLVARRAYRASRFAVAVNETLAGRPTDDLLGDMPGPDDPWPPFDGCEGLGRGCLLGLISTVGNRTRARNVTKLLLGLVGAVAISLIGSIALEGPIAIIGSATVGLALGALPLLGLAPGILGITISKGDLAFSAGIADLEPSNACPGDTITINGDFTSLLTRLKTGRVAVSFPTKSGCVQVLPTSITDKSITAVVPPDAKAGCIGFVDNDALDAYNKHVLAVNAQIAAANAAVEGAFESLCMKVPGGGILGFLSPVSNPCPPCNGKNLFGGSFPEVIEIFVENETNIELDAPNGVNVTVRWNVVAAKTATIQGIGFNGVESVPLQGSRVVSLPGSNSPTVHSWAIDVEPFCSGPARNQLTAQASATVLAVPTLSIRVLEPTLAVGNDLVRDRLAVFRIYIEDGLTGGSRSAVSLTVRVRAGKNFTATLGPQQSIAVFHPGGDPTQEVGQLFSLPMAAVKAWGCVEVEAEATFLSPGGTLSATATRTWSGKTTQRSVTETFYVYTTTFFGDQNTGTTMGNTVQALRWVEAMMPWRKAYFVERSNIDINWGIKHSSFTNVDGSNLAIALSYKAIYWDAQAAASVHRDVASTATVSGIAINGGFWFSDKAASQTACHEYLHTLGFGHFDGCGKTVAEIGIPDPAQPNPPSGTIKQPVSAPLGWFTDVLGVPVPDMSNGGAGLINLQYGTTQLAETVPGDTPDIMTYCDRIAVSRASYARAFGNLAYPPGGGVDPIEDFEGCAQARSPHRGPWLQVLGKGNMVLAVLTAGARYAGFSSEPLRWSVADTAGETFDAGTTSGRGHRTVASERWSITIPWDTLAARTLEIQRGRDVSRATPSKSEVEVRALPSAGDMLEVSWPTGDMNALARVEYKRLGVDDELWRDLLGVEPEQKLIQNGRCVARISMKGMPVSSRLEVRVSSSVGEGRRDGSTVINWDVPPPVVLWTSPVGDEVFSPNVMLDVSAFSPGDGICLDDGAVTWAIDDMAIEPGSRVYATLTPGEHRIRVRAQDSSGRVTEVERIISFRSEPRDHRKAPVATEGKQL